MEKLYLAVFWKSTCSSNPFSYPHSSDSWHNTVNICNHIIKSTISLQNNCLLQLFITVISLANTSTLILKLSITSNRASLTVDFAVGSLVLPKEKPSTQFNAHGARETNYPTSCTYRLHSNDARFLFPDQEM